MRREHLEKILAEHSNRMKIIADAIGDNEIVMGEVRLVSYQCSMLWKANFNQAREIDLLVKQKLKLQQVISKRKVKDAKDAARRCIEAIEAERKPRKGILQYENACNHAINAIRSEFDIEGEK